MTSRNRSELAEPDADLVADAAPAARDVSGTGPVARTLVACCALFCMFQYVPWRPLLFGPSILAVLAVVCVAAVSLRWRAVHDARIGTWVLSIGIVAGLFLSIAKSEFLRTSPVLGGGLAVVWLAATVLTLTSSGRRATAGFVALLGVFAVVAVGDMATIAVTVDVQHLLEGGIDATLAGASPYGITIPNMYGPEDAARFYPPGAVEDGRVMYGYSYLPTPLLLDIPARLLGDVRWMHLLALLLAAALAWRLATDRLGRTATVFLVLNPLSTTVLVSYSVEPLMICLLTLVVWGMARGSRWTGLVLGLFFASKQYALSYVPALWTVGRRSGWRVVWIAVASGAVVVGAFFLADPASFTRSAVDWLLLQPFREDSVSLVPGLVEVFGPIPDSVLILSPILGVAVSALVAWRTRPGPTSFALGVGLSLLLTVLLAKQAFMNYYVLAGSALLLAVVMWPRDDPVPELVES